MNSSFNRAIGRRRIGTALISVCAAAFFSLVVSLSAVFETTAAVSAAKAAPTETADAGASSSSPAARVSDNSSGTAQTAGDSAAVCGAALAAEAAEKNAETAHIDITDAESLISSLGDGMATKTEDGSVMLLRDITFSSQLRITGGDIRILGAGVRISGVPIAVTGGTLTLGKDGDSGEEPSLHFAGTGDGRAFEVSGGKLVLMDGVRIEGYEAGEGGAVLVLGGVLELRGGEIFDCSATHGGAILLDFGRATVFSGIIGNCSADEGGAVYLRSGSFELAGGCIGRHSALDDKGSIVEYGEPCSASRGGGIYVGGGECTLSGGEISGCSGSGVYVASYYQTFLSGSTINRCTAERGGGIYNDGEVIITGGSVNECTATEGGGIYNNSTLVLRGGKVFSCTAETLGGGLYNHATADMRGGAVTSGTAELGACIYNDSSFKFYGGTVGHGKTESGVGCGIASTRGMEISGLAYIYNDSTLALISDGGFVPLRINGELDGAEIMMHIEVIEQSSGGMRALRSPDTAVLAADSPELIAQAAEHLRYGADIAIKEDGTVSFDFRPAIIACSAAAAVAVVAAVIIIVWLRRRKNMMEMM